LAQFKLVIPTFVSHHSIVLGRGAVLSQVGGGVGWTRATTKDDAVFLFPDKFAIMLCLPTYKWTIIINFWIHTGTYWGQTYTFVAVVADTIQIGFASFPVRFPVQVLSTSSNTAVGDALVIILACCPQSFFRWCGRGGALPWISIRTGVECL
jgi:hypothetical protein